MCLCTNESYLEDKAKKLGKIASLKVTNECEIFSENLSNACKRTESRSAEVFTNRVEIMVNATQKCNLCCGYCFVGEGKFGYKGKRDKALSPNTAKRLVEELPKMLPWAEHFCIHFYGGEPLLNIDAMDAAVEAAKPMGGKFSFAIITNGTISSKKVINTLKKGRFNIILSIDGPEKIHDELRRSKGGKPTHKKVLKFLENAKAEGLYVRGSSVIRKGWSLKEATAYLETQPVDAIKAQAVRLPPEHFLALSGDERELYFRHLHDVAEQTINAISDNMVPKDDRFTSRVLQLLCHKKRESFCGAGKWTFGMACDGTMLPCVLLAGTEGVALGNINGNSRWVEQGQRWVADHKPREGCQQCWALPLCGGGCPAMLSVCGEDECDMVRKNCELALAIYGAFLKKPQDLIILSGVV